MPSSKHTVNIQFDNFFTTFSPKCQPEMFISCMYTCFKRGFGQFFITFSSKCQPQMFISCMYTCFKRDFGQFFTTFSSKYRPQMFISCMYTCFKRDFGPFWVTFFDRKVIWSLYSSDLNFVTHFVASFRCRAFCDFEDITTAAQAPQQENETIKAKSEVVNPKP